jgi:uncharacterized protein
MDKSQISSKIASVASDLRAAGISALYLFGSQGRGDASDESDVDLAFDIAEEADKRFSLLDQGRLQMQLQTILGRKVDFVERGGMRPRMRERVEREMIRLL